MPPPDAEENAEASARLIQYLDDRSLSLVIREACDDGRKTLSILRVHCISKSKPRVISLYTELTTLKKGREKFLTDYIIRAETAVRNLKNAGEVVSDSSLVAIVMKGLPPMILSVQL